MPSRVHTMNAPAATGGRPYESRRAVLEAVARSEFLSVARPDGALYAGKTTLDATAKNVLVVITNTGHKPLTK